MNFGIATFMKYGFSTVAFIVFIDHLYERYILRKRFRSLPLNEAVFVMSNTLTCCSHTENLKIINDCKNPHCKAKLSRKIIEHIDSAKHLICVAMYMFTMKHIGDAILNAKRRGVIIRIISDQSMIATSGTQINRLQSSGIAVRIAGNGDLYMHNKFCLIDVLINETNFGENTHPLNGVLINGSMNWTSNGFLRNWENIIFTSDETLKTEFKKAFDQIWSRIK